VASKTTLKLTDGDRLGGRRRVWNEIRAKGPRRLQLPRQN
jgi:hypothetical protein